MPNKKARSAALKWFFPSTGHGENDGFSDPLLEYFQGDHEKYVAREAIQNAVDARKDYDKPVVVIFERLSIPTDSFPAKQEFLSTLNACQLFVKGQKNAESFFHSATQLLQGKSLSVLKISDFNTWGLSGEDGDVDGNWYRLVRAAGTSSPKGVEGGSFGIGKGAPIASSSLHTVFYSSINDQEQCVFQGKARLVSHQDDSHDVRRGVGFFGIDGYRSVREVDLIPSFFQRSGQGTDIFVMGYKADDAWQSKLIKSVLQNFWLAIWRGSLEVTVKAKEPKTITKASIRAFLDEYDPGEAKYFFNAVTNWTQRFDNDLKHLGKVTLFVRKQDNYPGKVMMARKPLMVVYERPYRALREPYAGVFLCEDDRGNGLLRDLEPPAHDKWDRERAKNGWAAMGDLDTFIKNSLKSMGEAITSEPQDIPGLNRYLPDRDDREYLPQHEGESGDPTETESDDESGREIGANKEPTPAELEAVVRRGVVTERSAGRVTATPPKGPNTTTGNRPTGSEDGDKEGMRIKTSKIGFRSFVQIASGEPQYHFVITGLDDCSGAVSIVAIGDDGNYPVDLASAVETKTRTPYSTEGAMIHGISLKTGQTLKLTVTLAAKKKYTLGIENYEG